MVCYDIICYNVPHVLWICVFILFNLPNFPNSVQIFKLGIHYVIFAALSFFERKDKHGRWTYQRISTEGRDFC